VYAGKHVGEGVGHIVAAPFIGISKLFGGKDKEEKVEYTESTEMASDDQYDENMDSSSARLEEDAALDESATLDENSELEEMPSDFEYTEKTKIKTDDEKAEIKTEVKKEEM